MGNSTVEDAARVVEQKIDATREAMGDKAGRLRERVSEVAGNVKARAGEVADNVKTRAGALRDRIADTDWADVQTGVKNYVRDNPGKAVGVALGVGFALGLLLRRRDD